MIFQRFISLVKEAISKLKMFFNNNNLKQALNGADILVSSEMQAAIQKWAAMYVNQASWIKNGVVSMQLPATISSELARLVTIEMDVNVSGSARANFLQEQIKRILPKLNEQVEKGLALGGLIIKPYVKNDNLAVDFVRSDQFIPTAFDSNQNLMGCVFITQIQKGSTFYNRLEHHSIGTFSDESGEIIRGCSISNMVFRSYSANSLGNKTSLQEVPEWADISEFGVIKGAEQLLFGYFRPAFANNIDPNSPLPVSCYSRAADLIEQADKQFSRLCWEFESGERAIFVDQQAFDIDPKTKKPILPSLKERLYRTLKRTGGNVGDKQQLFQEFSPEFREASIQSGLNTMLKTIEFLCGLSAGTISDPQQVALTATEIKMGQQRTAATIRNNQKALETAINDLLYGMDAYCDVYGLAPIGSYVATYDWDDSIIVDSTMQFVQDSQVTTMGVMPKYIFAMRTYKIDEETAKKWVEEAQSESPSLGSLFGGGNVNSDMNGEMGSDMGSDMVGA